MPPNTPTIPCDGLAYYGESCEDKGLSTQTIKALINSISKSSLSSYLRYWGLFSKFSNKTGLLNKVSIPVICDFLVDLYDQGASSSTLNIARSALSFFCSNTVNIKDNSAILRLFKYFYKQRPRQVKYLTYWPVSQLLNYLSDLHPAQNLSLKTLTLKTLALIALTSSDRGQTIHSMNIENSSTTDNGIDFVIFDRLKNTGKIHKPKVISCLSSDIDSLNVCDYVKEYMVRTLPIRLESTAKGFDEPTQLFLSWHTKKPVTRQTLARWLRMSLSDAGIDTNQFTAHSYRGAGLSHAFNHGASIDQIVAHGCWTNTETFKRHYFAPANGTPIANIILRDFEKSEYSLL